MVFKRACRAQKDLALMIFLLVDVWCSIAIHADDFIYDLMIYDLAFFLKYCKFLIDHPLCNN
jgi:hypothetical protein